MTDRMVGVLALSVAVVGAGAAVAVLQGWRELSVFILVVVAVAAVWRAAAAPSLLIRCSWIGVVVGTVALVAVLVGTRSSVEPQPPVGSPGSPATRAEQDESASPAEASDGSAGRASKAPATSSCQADDGADVPCSAADAALALGRLAECSPEGVTVTWGLDPDLDNLLIDTVVGPDGNSCLVSPNAVSRAAGATAVDLDRARDGTVTAALRACADRDGTFSLACSERHELEFIGPWRAESAVDASELCQGAASRYTGINLSGPGLSLESVALSGRASTGEPQFRCAVVADRALDDSVRSLGGAELPTAED